MEEELELILINVYLLRKSIHSVIPNVQLTTQELKRTAIKTVSVVGRIKGKFVVYHLFIKEKLVFLENLVIQWPQMHCFADAKLPMEKETVRCIYNITTPNVKVAIVLMVFSADFLQLTANLSAILMDSRINAKRMFKRQTSIAFMC